MLWVSMYNHAAAYNNNHHDNDNNNEDAHRRNHRNAYATASTTPVLLPYQTQPMPGEMPE